MARVIKSTKSSYAAIGYQTDHYDSQEVHTFRSVDAMWSWARAYLSRGNRKVVAYRRQRNRWNGMLTTKVAKIAEITDANEVPA